MDASRREFIIKLGSMGLVLISSNLAVGQFFNVSALANPFEEMRLPDVQDPTPKIEEGWSYVMGCDIPTCFIGVGPFGRHVLQMLAPIVAQNRPIPPWGPEMTMLLLERDAEMVSRVIKDSRIVFLAGSVLDPSLAVLREMAAAAPKSLVVTALEEPTPGSFNSIKPAKNECILPYGYDPCRWTFSGQTLKDNLNIIGNIMFNIYSTFCLPSYIGRDVADFRKLFGGKWLRFEILSGKKIQQCIEQFYSINNRHDILARSDALFIFFKTHNNTDLGIGDIVHATKKIYEGCSVDTEICFHFIISENIVDGHSISVISASEHFKGT